MMLVLAAGCGGGDASPVEKCDDLLDLLCDRAVQCISNPGSHASCVQELQQVIPCGTVKAVSASYDRCIDQVDSFACPVLFPFDPQTGGPTLELPADCMGVVLSRTVGDDAQRCLRSSTPLSEFDVARKRRREDINDLRKGDVHGDTCIRC